MGRLGSWPHVVRHFVGGRPQPARALLALLGGVAALSFVFPGVSGVGWDALPVVDPLFSLIVLISGGYELFASALFTTPCTPSSRRWSSGRSPRVGAGCRTRRSGPPRGRPVRTTAVPAADAAPPQWPELRDAGTVRGRGPAHRRSRARAG